MFQTGGPYVRMNDINVLNNKKIFLRISKKQLETILKVYL